MLEMLKARKAELEARGTKGFTLMEMLIVIAIIAVLIAIAIPVFTSQLDSADKATTEANGRSLYAMLMADYMDDQSYNTVTEAGTIDNQTFGNADTLTAGGQVFAAKGKYKIIPHCTAGSAPYVQVTDGTNVIDTFGTAAS